LKVLIVGGAGYIGSHMVKTLTNNNHRVVTFDNLSNGYRDAVLYGDFIHGDLEDKKQLSQVFDAHLLALDTWVKIGQSGAFNLGNGNGFSVQRVIDVAKMVTGVHFDVADEPRREGIRQCW